MRWSRGLRQRRWSTVSCSRRSGRENVPKLTEHNYSKTERGIDPDRLGSRDQPVTVATTLVSPALGAGSSKDASPVIPSSDPVPISSFHVPLILMGSPFSLHLAR